MAQKEDTNKYIFAALSTILIVLVIAKFTAGGAGLTGGYSTPASMKHQIECTVNIVNKFGVPLIKSGSLDIADYTCVDKGACSLFQGFTTQYGILSDSGTVVLDFGGKKATKSITVNEAETKGVVLKVCSESLTGTITVFEDDQTVSAQRNAIAS